ncbi:MAG: hypothetical protein BMS9Abin11_0886 [Gammaproteobacteria bacterium]|nr:MAG: hypothetical protein BMS9Abin11_0886 [Gammaproteobacteria bacterium]
MSATSKIDPSTLGWVKAEIDETLKQARLALESYAENTADGTRLRFCITHLHQVVGTLEMVELDGVALLAKETEIFARDIIDDKIKADTENLEVLTQSILTIPDYLSRLQFGQPDAPLRFVPSINAMRKVRGMELISEVDLFDPDLSVRPAREKDERAPIDENEFKALAKKLRHPFQLALLKWLRNTDDKESLNEIASILGQLGTKANVGVVEQLFWVADGYVEALLSGDLETTNERKRLFSRVDQQIRKLIEGGEKSTLRNSSESLIKNILYQIAYSKSNGPKVKQLKRAFDLDQIVGAEVNDMLHDVASIPTPDALQSVSVALGKEVESAQDVLSAYFDPDQEDVSSLAELQEILHKMSSTLDMLGVPMLQALIDELARVCAGITGGQIPANEKVSMVMARSLLLFENSAREIHKSAASWKRQFDEVVTSLQHLLGGADGLDIDGLEVSEVELSETEYNQLLGVVGDEIRINLGKIEEALETFAADTRRVEFLEQVPTQLNQVQGALEILQQDHAAQLSVATLQCIDDISNRVITADADVLDGLAVAIGSIGAYVEGLQYNRPNLDEMISRAIGDLEASIAGKQHAGSDPGALVDEIHKQLDNWLHNTDDDSAIAAMSQHLDALSLLAQQQGQEKIDRISGEMNKLLQIIHDDPGQLSDDIVGTLKQSFDTLALLSKQYLKATAIVGSVVVDEPILFEETVEADTTLDIAPGTMAAAPMDMSDDAIDEEILEIFIEDARDVLKTIEKETAVWASDPNNYDSMLELRRGYHTLKGSGRMVGASTISELAWAVENMLNSVRDGKIAYTDPMTELLQEVRAVLPGLIDQFERKEESTVDIESLSQRADTLRTSSPVPAVAPGIVESGPLTPSAEPEVTMPVLESGEGPAGDIPQLDDTLLQIFTSEVEGHIETIKNDMRACMDNATQCAVSADLMRAMHTLRGSARSLGLEQMAEACGEMEKLLQEMKAVETPLSETHLKILAELESCVSELVVVINKGLHQTPGDLSLRFVDLHQLIMTQHQQSGIEPMISAAATPAIPEFVPVPPIAAPAATPAPIAEPSAPAIPAAVSAVDDNIDNELLEIFLEEAVDILGNVEHALSNWRASPEQNSNDIHELKRALHTLKGGSRMAGLMSIGDLSHSTETALTAVEQGSLQADADFFNLFDEVHDTLAVAIDQMSNHQPMSDISHLTARVTALVSGEPVPEAAAFAPTSAPPVESIPATFDTLPVSTTEPAFAAQPAESAIADVPMVASSGFGSFGSIASEEEPAEKKERTEVTRVRTELLDNLVNFAGEVSISRSRMEQQIYNFRDNLKELHGNVERFRAQIRDLEIQSESQIMFRAGQEESAMGTDFDPLEFDRFSNMQHLSRGLNESLHDLSTIQSQLDNFVGEAETTLQQQARINTDLQEGLMRTRMVSFSTQSARLRHIVRQTARELGKNVELKLLGSEVEVDRNVLERMIGPFEHMIRNAVDHGMETEAERRQSGKPPVGTITIDTRQQGSEIMIRFSDDGKGLGIDIIRQKAVEKGLMSEGERLSDDAVIQYILVSGFSTASEITHLSGRGVGMDVVHNEVKQLGGAMAVDTEMGQGTSFVIRLPLTLSVTQALLVTAGEQLFAVPLSAVENIIEAEKEELNKLTLGKKPMFNYNDQVYPFVNMSLRMGLEPHPRSERKVAVLLVKTGTRNYAMEVDGLIGTKEVVVKAMSPLLSELSGFAGATIMGDGTVIPIIDAPGLLLSDKGMSVSHGMVATMRTADEKLKRERPLVMIVDDSLTVRKITSRHLERRGMDVITAKDGLDAVEQLRETIPDVMLVDIEMPRMDGYELTSRVRSESTLKHIPIIMITSRAGEKHRKRAFDLGVNEYMSKPYQEDELVTNIERVMGETVNA